MQPTELAWLAGLLEGEGNFRLHSVKGKWFYPEVSLMMTDEDIVRRAHTVTGLGKVYGPYKRPNRKPTWTWRLTKLSEAGMLMELVLPMMGERRSTKIREVLERS